MPNYRKTSVPYSSYRQMPVSYPSEFQNVMEHSSLAMAYVPWQTWRNINDAEKGFRTGTIFQELNMPFLGKGGMKR